MFMDSKSHMFGAFSTNSFAKTTVFAGGGQLYMWGKIKNSGDDWMYPKPLMDLRFSTCSTDSRSVIVQMISLTDGSIF